MLTRQRGGSNYFCCDYTNQIGVISSYSAIREQSLIDRQLNQMRESGQESIQLLMLLHKDPPSDVYIKFDGSELDWKIEDSFEFLLQNLVEKHGFKWVGIVPEFWGELDFRKNNLTQDQIYEYFLFLQRIYQRLNIYPIDHCIDLCAEIDPSPSCIDYAQLLWTWWTATYYPKAAPCQNGTMSIMPSLDNNYNFIGDIFRGTDKTGKINWPGRINLHTYDGQMQAVLEALWKLGLPLNRQIYIGEIYTIIDPAEEIHCERMCNWQLENNIPLERLIQYPIRVKKTENPEVDVIPTSWVWGKYGY